MLNQHQFWVTKKTVQRKLGGKEDQCIVTSDSELDLKIGLFNSISSTTQALYRVLDMYQERVSFLAMEETQLGQFLREHGKLNKSSGSGKRMSTAGKAISYTGQQRMCLRSPLIRLHSELDTFRSRAVADTQATISGMEKDRTEYRAALSWMKSINLNPDDDRALEKFRKAQQTVRWSKEKFDKKSLDCLEKIDLLAAARCNMFSHVLVAYHKAMQTFAHKTYETFKVAAKILENEPHYAFSILRDLTQAEKEPAKKEQQVESPSKIPEMRENAIDADQLLFFQDEYSDTDNVEKATREEKTKPPAPAIIDTETNSDFESLISVGGGEEEKKKSDIGGESSILSGLDEQDAFLLDSESTTGGDADLLNMDFGFLAPNAESSRETDPLLDLLGQGPSADMAQSMVPGGSGTTAPQQQQPGKSMFSALTNKISELKPNKGGGGEQQPASNKSKNGGKDMSSWFKLFSELDPLANPDAMSKQIDGSNSHSA